MKRPHGKQFKPAPHPGGWITLALAILFLGLGIRLIAILPGQPVSAPTFWMGIGAMLGVGLGCYFFYRAVAFLLLRYSLTRNGLEIRWGALTRRIPIGSIIELLPAETISFSGPQIIRTRLPYWWVWRWGKIVSFATAPMQNSLRLRAKEGDFIISPEDVEAFRAAWELRAPLGPTQKWKPEVIRRSVWGHPLWSDQLALRLGTGAILLCLILVGSFFTDFPSWPAAMPIRFNALGQASAIVSRQQLLWIPAGGAIVLVFNLILGFLWYRHERLATILLWFVAMLVQIGLWTGIRMVTG